MADEVQGHVFDDGHVVGPVPGAQTGEVVVEDDVVHPVQPVLDAPMGTHGGGEGVGVEAGGGDVVALRVPGPAVVLGGGLDHGDGGEAGEGSLAGVSAVRLQPIDDVADPVTALLDEIGRGPCRERGGRYV